MHFFLNKKYIGGKLPSTACRATPNIEFSGQWRKQLTAAHPSRLSAEQVRRVSLGQLSFKAAAHDSSETTADNSKMYSFDNTISSHWFAQERWATSIRGMQAANHVMQSSHLACSAASVRRRLRVELATYHSSHSCYRFDSSRSLSQKIILRNQLIIGQALFYVKSCGWYLCHQQWQCARAWWLAPCRHGREQVGQLPVVLLVYVTVGSR